MQSAPTTPTGYVIRPPQQARSAASWRRILDAGRAIIEEGGADALTLSALCERAQVAPTTVYQRVDSMGGLLFALFVDGMKEVDEFSEAGISEAEQFAARTPERVRGVIDAVCETFRKYANFLHATTEHSVGDDNFWQEENVNSNQSVDAATSAISFGNEATARECALYIFSENMIRNLFGSHWMGSTKEDFDRFRERVFRMVWARLNFDGES